MAADPTSLRVQPREAQPRMAWRNGGGATREVFTWPPASDLATFAWRVSVATIERDGAFSVFADVTRTAVLIDGAGLRLRSDAGSIELAQPFARASFDGSAQWHCELMEGRVHLFNVMVRRPLTGRVELALQGAAEAPAARHRVAYAASGAASVRTAGQRCELHEGDACIVAGESPSPLSVVPAGPRSCAFVVVIDEPSAP